MIDEVRKLLDDYSAWLKDKTSMRQVEGWIEITTPHLDRHNDYLQIYAQKEGNEFILTDDGYIISDLDQSGCKLNSHKRQALLRTTLNGFGVRLVDGRLEVHANMDNFAIRKHSLVQAMLAVNDLFYLAEPIVTSLFLEDVTSWLDLHQVRYIQNVQFTGKTGYSHHFDFAIPRAPQLELPERILKTISRPSRDTAEALVLSWIDSKEVRPEDSKAYAILNDSNHHIATGVFDALKSYDVNPILWSERQSALASLAS